MWVGLIQSVEDFERKEGPPGKKEFCLQMPLDSRLQSNLFPRSLSSLPIWPADHTCHPHNRVSQFLKINLSIYIPWVPKNCIHFLRDVISKCVYIFGHFLAPSVYMGGEADNICMYLWILFLWRNLTNTAPLRQVSRYILTLNPR